VQGHELDALIGAYRSLVDRKIDIIISEFSPALFDSETHAHLYLNLIASQGYTIYALQRIDFKYARHKVDLSRNGVDVSSWQDVHTMRKSGDWVDLLCVRTTILNNVL
jgi:hypothetical protein